MLKKSLWFKFFCFYTLPILLLIFIWISHYTISTEKSKLENLLQYRETLNQQTLSILDSNAAALHRQSYVVYSDTESMLTIFQGPSHEGYYAARSSFQRIMDNFMLITKEFDGIVLLDFDGNAIYLHDRKGSFINYRNAYEEEWYQNILHSSGNNTDIIITSLQLNNKDTLVVTSGKTIYNPETFQEVGIMLCFCYLDNFVQSMKETLLEDRELLQLLDKEGKVIYSYGSNISDYTLLEEYDHYQLVSVNGESMIRTSASSSKYGWSIISYTPYANATLFQSLFENTNIITFLLIIFVALIGSTINYKQMLRRIQRLTAEQYALKLTKTQSELEALQSQINPHFLFNTLNSIKAISDTGKNQNASQMVQSLSDLLRYTLSQGKFLVAFSEELNTVQKYLYLQSYRFGNRFSVSFDIEEEVFSLEVPRLLLQPLVENAIKHGLEPLSTHGELIITAKILQEKLFIYISNTGVPIPVEKLETLNRKLRDVSISSDFSSEKVGLLNVWYRLKLHYNEHCSMTISSTQKFTTIKLIIPARKFEPIILTEMRDDT